MATPLVPTLNRPRLAGLWRHRELVVTWARRDVASRFAGSFLGVWWAVLQPLFMLALYTLVFSVVLKVHFGTNGHGNFTLYLFAGLLPWLAFAETLTRATTVITGHPNFVKKVVFPLEVLPVGLVASATVSQFIGLALLLLAALALGTLHATALWLVPIIALQLAFTLGASWFLASLGVFVRDLASAISLVLNTLMYVSPILYPATMVPEAYRKLFLANPIAFWAEASRRAILEGIAPSPQQLAAQTALALAVLFAGHAWFVRTQRAFADVL